jgi:O-antigen/teichoic acid export membrane protein
MTFLQRQVLVTAASLAVSVLLSVANAVVLARWLGPEGKGLVALALLLPETLSLVLGGGIEAANVYLSATGRFRPSELASASVALTLVASGLGFVAIGGLFAVGALSRFVPGLGPEAWGLAMLALPPLMLTSHVAGILRGRGNLTAVNAIRALQGLFHLGLTVVLVVVWPWGPLGALLAAVAGALTGTVLAAVALHWLGGELWPRWNRTVVVAALAYGLRGHVGTVSQHFIYRLDALLVNYFLGTGGVGLYVAAVRIAEVLLLVPNAMAFVVFPAAASRGPREATEMTRQAVGLSSALAVAGAGALALAGPTLIRVVYSDAFAEAYLPLLTLLPGIVFLGAAKVLASEVAGRGYPHYNSAISTLGLPVTLALHLVLIPRYGLVGAAAATSLAYAYSLGGTLAVRRFAQRS